MAAPSHSLRSPEELASCFPKAPDYEHTVLAMAHRQRLIKAWNIAAGSKVLEFGCGHGDMTIPLADTVGPSGRVIAVDPGAADYGTPPLGEAHKQVRASPVGEQIEFVRADPADYLEAFTEPEPFDYIVLSYCICYFSDPEILPKMLALARKHTTGATLLIAEHALVTSLPAAVPHVLVTLALNALESFRDASSRRNIRTALMPSQITAAAGSTGWLLEKGDILVPDAGLRDAEREVDMALHPRKRYDYHEDVQALQVTPKTKSMLYAMQDALRLSVTRLDGEGGMQAVRNMDTWVARFVPGEKSE